MARKPIGQELRTLVSLRKKRDELKTKFDTAELEFKQHQAHCIQRMEEENCEGHKAHGYSFSPVSKEYATIQDRSEFVRWAQENDVELVEVTERKALLNALVRERLDNGEPLPPGVGFYQREYISMRESS